MQTTWKASIAAAYQVVAQMATFEGHLIWQKIQAFLICNSLIIAAIAAFRDSTDKLRFVIALLGLATCILWWPILVRAWAMYRYWLGCARALELAVAESCALITFFTDLSAFARWGCPLGSGRDARVPPLGLLASTKSLTMLMIGLFAAVYGYVVVAYIVTRES